MLHCRYFDTASDQVAAAGIAMGMTKNLLTLSVVIPAHDEQENLSQTVAESVKILSQARIPYEIVVVNDNSVDGTQQVAEELAETHPGIVVVTRHRLPGFGRAIRAGLAKARGDVVTIVMADSSDDPQDVVRCYRKIEEGYDCVFGSRFRKGSKVEGYPVLKLVVNRIVNRLIQVIFLTRFNDITNAFKMYRREVLVACGPFSASHFNISLEMSLGALIRKYHIAEIPINWHGRTWGASKLRLTKMGRRYLSVLLKVFFERILVSDDILAERLLEKSTVLDRVGMLEDRIANIEKSIGAAPLPAASEAAAESQSVD